MASSLDLRYPKTVTPKSQRRFAAVLALSAIFALVCQAAARSEGESKFTLKQTYSTALRYLRVELGFEVVERDPDAAYLLFRYIHPGAGKRIVEASIEMVQTKDLVRVVVRIPAMPSYHEQMVRDGLLRKLSEDYGEPPPPRESPPPKKKSPKPESAETEDGFHGN